MIAGSGTTEAVVLVKALPHTSTRHGETVCCAGIERTGRLAAAVPHFVPLPRTSTAVPPVVHHQVRLEPAQRRPPRGESARRPRDAGDRGQPSPERTPTVPRRLRSHRARPGCGGEADPCARPAARAK